MITIHGRGSYSALIHNEPNDLSNRVVYFELYFGKPEDKFDVSSENKIRMLLPTDINDPTAKRLDFGRAEINMLPISSNEFPIFEFAIIDETKPGTPVQIGNDYIQIVGFRSE